MSYGVSDGQAVSAAVTNPAFVVKNNNDTLTFKYTLADVDSISGGSISNIQREYNALWSFLGGSSNQVYNYKPSWATSYFGLSTDTIKQRIEAIDASAVTRSQTQAISIGVDTITTVFSASMPDTSYAVSFDFECSDALPIFFNGVVTAKTTGGFTLKLNALTDSINYKLNYRVTRYV